MDLDAAFVCLDHRVYQGSRRKQKHLDSQRYRRMADGVEKRLRRVVGQDDQFV
jgi:hypothetical protein